MESATIELPMRPNIREHLRDVRRGKFTLAECLDEIADLSARLTAATSRSELPEAADDRVVNAWLAQTYRAWWERV
ncbi:MAG: hypothetical protein LLG14_13580 [Nocardiaceae bacterium]|nr:hypothetical protein [Nocardiaceae bacterium]